jgi:hypothetical protein
MIPINILCEHILQAIEFIDKNGIPPKRKSTKYLLKFNDKFYPPKYVLSIANKFANGTELDSALFYGGGNTNSFLNSLGFDITTINNPKSLAKRS